MIYYVFERNFILIFLFKRTTKMYVKKKQTKPDGCILLQIEKQV